MALWRKFFHLQLDSEDVTETDRRRFVRQQLLSNGLSDSTFTELIVRSELVEAAGGRLIKQNELLTACTDTRSIDAHDMHTQCELVPMEASRTAASRLINV